MDGDVEDRGKMGPVAIEGRTAQQAEELEVLRLIAGAKVLRGDWVESEGGYGGLFDVHEYIYFNIIAEFLGRVEEWGGWEYIMVWNM